jgi:hypothetical protein
LIDDTADTEVQDASPVAEDLGNDLEGLVDTADRGFEQGSGREVYLQEMACSMAD